MAITVEATYQNGTLKLAERVPLKANETVQVTIEPHISWAERTAGMIKWSGDVATLERIAIDPEFDPQEGA